MLMLIFSTLHLITRKFWLDTVNSLMRYLVISLCHAKKDCPIDDIKGKHLALPYQIKRYVN
jgi:hypothetical protein